MDERAKCETGNHQNCKGSNLFDIGHSNFLLDMSPEGTETKAKMNYWNLVKIKSFCTVKETINKTKRQPMEWKKILANDISDKELKKPGTPGWLSNSASAFSLGRDPGVPGWSPTSGSLHGACFSLCLCL